jgi:hypothetical protein
MMFAVAQRAAAEAEAAAAEAAAAEVAAAEAAAAAKEALPSLAELDLAMATVCVFLMHCQQLSMIAWPHSDLLWQNKPIKLSAQHLHQITDNFSGALLGQYTLGRHRLAADSLRV